MEPWYRRLLETSPRVRELFSQPNEIDSFGQFLVEAGRCLALVCIYHHWLVGRSPDPERVAATLRTAPPEKLRQLVAGIHRNFEIMRQDPNCPPSLSSEPPEVNLRLLAIVVDTVRAGVRGASLTEHERLRFEAYSELWAGYQATMIKGELDGDLFDPAFAAMGDVILWWSRSRGTVPWWPDPSGAAPPADPS